MTSIAFTQGDCGELSADVLVVATGQDQEGALRVLSGSAPLHLALDLAATLTLVGATGAEGELICLPTRGAVAAPLLAAVGLGSISSPPRPAAEALRRAAGTAIRRLAGRHALVLDLLGAVDLPVEEAVAAITEGVALGGYRFDRYRSKAKPRAQPAATCSIPVGTATGLAPVRDHARIIADAVNLARDLVNTTAADLTPTAFAGLAAKKAAHLDVDVIGAEALRDGGYGGLTGVGRGSANPPALVRVGYRPEAPRMRVALVGKGITFDSGGLDLKANDSMGAMYSDMAGAAAVLATVLAAAELNLPIEVVSWLAIAENMPGAHALRPSDVLTMYGGKTVEVVSPDAEGRLVLADGIVRAAEEQPDIIIDIATLTGMHTFATGGGVTAVMANDDALRAQLCAAGETAGENCWPVPLPIDLRKTIDSKIADLRNSGGRSGALAIGGLFLREFVPGGTAWAHLDIGGAQLKDEAAGYQPSGATGVGVRTLVRYLEHLAAARAGSDF